MRGWEEAKINSSNPLRYDRQSGEFLVVRAGLYYLYCQVSPTWPHGTAGMGWGGNGGGGGGGELKRGGELGVAKAAGNGAAAGRGLDSAASRPAGRCTLTRGRPST